MIDYIKAVADLQDVDVPIIDDHEAVIWYLLDGHTDAPVSDRVPHPPMDIVDWMMEHTAEDSGAYLAVAPYNSTVHLDPGILIASRGGWLPVADVSVIREDIEIHQPMTRARGV